MAGIGFGKITSRICLHNKFCLSKYFQHNLQVCAVRIFAAILQQLHRECCCGLINIIYHVNSHNNGKKEKYHCFANFVHQKFASAIFLQQNQQQQRQDEVENFCSHHRRIRKVTIYSNDYYAQNAANPFCAFPNYVLWILILSGKRSLLIDGRQTRKIKFCPKVGYENCGIRRVFVSYRSLLFFKHNPLLKYWHSMHFLKLHISS